MQQPHEGTGRNVATVNFCEREACQTMGKSSAMGALTYALHERGNTARVELCPGCVAEFVAWLADQPAGPRPRAYQEPYQPPATGLDAMTGEEMMSEAMTRMRLELER